MLKITLYASTGTKAELNDAGTQTDLQITQSCKCLGGKKPALKISWAPPSESVSADFRKAVWIPGPTFSTRHAMSEVPSTGRAIPVERRITSLVDGAQSGETITTTWNLIHTQELNGRSLEEDRRRCLQEFLMKIRDLGENKVVLRPPPECPNFEEELRNVWGAENMEVLITGHKPVTPTYGQVVARNSACPPTTDTSPPAAPNPRAPRQRKKNRPRHGAVVIDANGRGYAETLKAVKECLQRHKAASTTIRAIRQSNKGDVVIETVGKNPEAQRLVDALKGSEASARVAGGMALAEVANIDALATAEEVAEALGDAMGADHGARVRLRRARGNTQVATVTATRECVERLLAVGTLSVGLVQCRVKTVKGDPQCFRCLETGHLKRNCQGPDRSAACFRCGCAGHQARECPNKAQCLKCGKVGHRTGSPACPGPSIIERPGITTATRPTGSQLSEPEARRPASVTTSPDPRNPPADVPNMDGENVSSLDGPVGEESRQDEEVFPEYPAGSVQGGGTQPSTQC